MYIFALRPSSLILLVFLGAGLLAPHYVYPGFLMNLLCFALFASAYNLLVGYVGLLAFGHAVFFGGASYATGYMLRDLGLTPEVSILIGVIFAAALGLVMGITSIRRRGIYFSMITLALAQMFYFLCAQSSVTGGENGLTAIPRSPLFGIFDISNELTLYYLILAVVAAAMFVIYRTVHSPFGHVLKGIRDNENRMISLGYDVDRFKVIAFTLSAALAGLAGSLKAIALQLVTLVDVHWSTSGEVILMALIGGIGTTVGPIIGAGVILTLQNYLTGFAEWVITIQGAILFLTVLLFRRGIAGEVERLFRIRQARSASSQNDCTTSFVESGRPT